MKVIQVQPSAYTDNMWATEGGDLIEGHRLPYPFPARADNGHIINQEFWRGTPYRIIGFANTPEPGKLDLYWDLVVDEPDQVIGKYVVTQDKGGGMAVHTTAIESVRVFEIPEEDAV